MNILIGLATIIIVIFVIYILFIIQPKLIDEPSYSYSTIRPFLKTGDIMMFSCRDHLGGMETFKYYARTSLVDSEYSHVGVVMRDGDRYYVLESTNVDHAGDSRAQNLNSYGKGGVRIINLDHLIEDYYKAYSGTFGVRFISKEIPNEILLKHLESYRECTFDSRSIIIPLAFVDLSLSHKLACKMNEKTADPSKILCSEFTHEILNKCGVMKDYPSKLFWPFMYDWELFNLYTNVEYSQLYKFVYYRQYKPILRSKGSPIKSKEKAPQCKTSYSASNAGFWVTN